MQELKPNILSVPLGEAIGCLLIFIHSQSVNLIFYHANKLKFHLITHAPPVADINVLE